MATKSDVTHHAAAASSSYRVEVEERERVILHLLRASLIAFTPGAAQGATTVLLGHPLDTAKVRMQAAGPHAAPSTFGTMWSMASSEGVRSLYRGVVPPLVMEGAKRSLQFALWDWLRARAAAVSAANLERADDLSLSASPSAGVMGTARRCAEQALVAVGGNTFLSGALSGGVGTLIGCPMHVIKIQTQYQTARDTQNAWTCMRDIYAKEGFFGYYRGFRYNVAKDVCFAGMYLGLYAELRDHPLFHTSSTTSSTNSSSGSNSSGSSTTTKNSGASPARTSHFGAFLSGATASMATWTLLYPLDTAKTLVQAKQAHILPFLLQHPTRLYRGLVASLWKAGPVSGVAMAVYEETWTLMNKRAS